jgi:general secretion pathway protein A
MYERFFGLVDAPFRLTPDPRYLFLSRKHADALAHLRLGLSESSGFVCITGDVGTGKTTVLRHFLGELAPESSVAYVVNPTLSPLELLQTINAEFGLPAHSTSKKELIDQLNRHLLTQREAGSRSVVVVDEAQALSMEVLEHLRLLSNLETTTEKLLRIILVGQPQLRALLAHPELAQLNQRITLRWHIGPLDREETMAYVRHRLEIASEGQVRDVFSRPALRAIHGRSHGVPRLINMLAHRAMLAAFAAERRTVTLRSVRRAYREVVTLPLPGRPSKAPRAAAWTNAALAAAVA